MYWAPRPLQSVPERSESTPERSGAIYPDPSPVLSSEFVLVLSSSCPARWPHPSPWPLGHGPRSLRLRRGRR
eukprot:2932399-Pyramimonas_sp.AAC.1